MHAKTTPHKKHFFSIIFFLSFILAFLMVACDSDSASSNEHASSEDPSDDNQTDSDEDGNFVDGILTDPRDGQKYKTVVIGSQIWMAENLNYETEKSTCYDDDPSNCSKYGRLYTWNAATDIPENRCSSKGGCDLSDTIQGICPSGWHIPKDDEWRTLLETIGGYYIAGKVLKSKSDWETETTGTDKFGFDAKPAGVGARGAEKGRRTDSVFYYDKGESAFFWSASEEGRAYWIRDYEYAYWGTYINDFGFSVRCLYDKPADKPKPGAQKTTERAKGTMTDSRDGQKYKVVTIGSQTWMAENLNYKMEGTFCYNDSSKYCDEYGQYYWWKAAIKACPEGWHLPISEEWDELFDAVGGKSESGLKLKSSDGWYLEDEHGNLLKSFKGEDGKTYSYSGTDKYGFSILPAGYIHGFDDSTTTSISGYSENVGSESIFWTADANPFISAGQTIVTVGPYDEIETYTLGWIEPSLSIRCLQNQ